jgi:glycine oxidase
MSEVPSPFHSPSRIAGAKPRVAITGAGIIGLGVGWRLARAGAVVDIFERGEAGRGASWAAAGMLSAALEAEPGEERLFILNRKSQALWPGFAEELERASGLDVGYRREGTLLVALTRDATRELAFTLDFARGLGARLEWLDGRDALGREPHLHPATLGAVFSPDDHQVDNRCVVRALKTAYLAAGGQLHENAPVDAVEISGGRARGLRVGGHVHEADAVLLAAGAWSRGIKGLPASLSIPVRPVKGQMLALRMDPRMPLLNHVLWAPKAYLVPRRDGRLIVGATVEERGFDGSLTAGGMLALLEAAWRALPAIEELPIEEMWAGFRPGSRDDAPLLGPTEVDGLVLATGHHRNGILLAPITIGTMSRFILTGELDPAIVDFGLGRFAAARPAERRGAS